MRHVLQWAALHGVPAVSTMSYQDAGAAFRFTDDMHDLRIGRAAFIDMQVLGGVAGAGTDATTSGDDHQVVVFWR